MGKPFASHADKKWAWVDLLASNSSSEGEMNDLITVRIATSFISVEQAMVNLQAEVGWSPLQTFDAAVAGTL